MGGRRIWARTALLVSLVTAAGMLATHPANAATAAINSPGPLTRVEISDTLNCAVSYVSDEQPEFYGDTACGTLVVVDGVLYGPESIPAGGSAAPRTAYTPVSQSGPTGSGTDADPYTIVTVVAAGETGITLTETDTYVSGQESYRTDVQISSSAPGATDVRIYRAGDCYLQDSDSGFGAVDAATGAVSCVGIEPGSDPVVPGSRIIQWLPITSGSHYMEDGYSTVWAQIGAQESFPDTCECDLLQDNGAGLSWDVNVPASGSRTVSSIVTFSPLGTQPLSTTKTADAAQTAPGGPNGYTITVSNPNTGAVTVDAITDTLPAGFSYTTGSTTGATTNDPTVNGQDLEWAGPFEVPAGGNVELSFAVTVSASPGTYYNNAGAAAEGVTVAPTGDTAPVEVTGGGAENMAPVADDQSVAVDEDTAEPITLTATDDGLPDPPAALTFAVVTPPAHGELSGTAPSLVYTPDAGYTGADSFTFSASDGELDSNVATVSIEVTGGSEQAPSELFAMNAGVKVLRDGRLWIPWAWVRLTDADTGDGIGGATVELSVGGEALCTTTTSPWGWAKCGGYVTGDASTIAGGYDVAFAGDDTYAASEDHGNLFRLRHRRPCLLFPHLPWRFR